MTIKALVKRHPVLTYFALTFVISWGGVLFIIGSPWSTSGVKAQDSPLFPLAVLAMIAGPSIAGVSLTALVHGRRGLRQFASRLFRWHVAPAWYAVALLTAPLVAVLVTRVLGLFSQEFLAPALVTESGFALLVLGGFVGLVAGCFEELGWTGFATPHLNERHSALGTGIILGVVWSAWHVLVITWGIGGRAGTVPLALFLIVDGLGTLPAFRVLMVMVYDRTESLLLAILMHLSLTATVIILTPVTTGAYLLVYGAAFAAVTWTVIAVLGIGSRRSRLGHTTPIADPDGEPRSNSIAEVDYLMLGGVRQWVMLRGDDLANPPLIHLHGGPGFSEMRLFRHYNAALEKLFTVVSWDQRGTAKSFASEVSRASMNMEQFLADLDELVDHVRARLRQDRVVIFGHSWGSVLGVVYTARFPGKVSAYIGSAQVGDWLAAESASYRSAVAEAQRRDNVRAIRQLEAIGPPPYDAASVMTERMWHQRFAGEVSPRALWTLGRVLFGGPESSLFDVPSVIRGFWFSLDTMWKEVSSINLLSRVPSLQVPVFFLLGRRDRWVPAETSLAYFTALKAPSKQLVWFERSAHEPFVDEPEKFNAVMADLVRPAIAPREPEARAA